MTKTSALAALGLALLANAGPAPRGDLESVSGAAIPITETRRAETGNDVRLIDALMAYIPIVMRAHRTPGLNIALARRGRVIWEAGFGYANLASRRPMTPATAFHSGSMGKTYVATAIMQLVEQGAFGLDDSVNRYLKEFRVTNPLGSRAITFRDLLTHHAGIGPNGAFSEFTKPVSLGEHLKRAYADSMLEMYDRSAVRLWTAKVGEHFEYSNLGMATLGYLVEITNPERLSFSDYVQKHIIDPLGMKSTRFPPVQDSVHVGPDIWSRLSTGYTSMGDVQIPTPTIYFADFPAGTMVSTPGEHLKLILAYLGRGTYNGYRLLKPETVEQMITPQADGGPGTKLGIAWMLTESTGSGVSFGHGGAHMFGWNNDYRAYPKLDFAVAIATNHWRLPTVAIDRENVLIEEFIASWIRNANRAPDPDRSIASWAWKTSYVMGLLMVDNLKGQLGIQSPITPTMIDAMALGARVGVAAAGREAGWDPNGFRAGVSDLLKVAQVPDSVRAFIASNRLRVSPAELDQIGKELGNRLIPLLAGPLQ